MKPSARLREIVQGRSLLRHPFYQAWTKGLLDRETLGYYAEQYYAHVEAFPRFVSSVHSRCPELAVRKVLAQNLADEEIHGTDHPTLWMQFAEGLGRTPEQVRAAERNTETRETVETFYDLTSRDWREGLCALYSYEVQVPEVSESKIDGLEKHYGITDARSLAFFKAHVTYDREHSARVAELLDASGVDMGVAESATREACDALWKFLDGVVVSRKLEHVCS